MTLSSTGESPARISKISRKVKACLECKKQKVRCVLETENGACTRCLRIGLDCVFTKSLQTILDEDTQERARFGKDLSRLRRVTDDILSKLQLPGLDTYDDSGNPTVPARVNLKASSHYSPAEASLHNSYLSRQQEVRSEREWPSENSGNQPPSPLPVEAQQVHVSGDIDASAVTGNETAEADGEALITEPMGSLYEVTKLKKFRRRTEPDAERSVKGEERLDDFISRGIITLEQADFLHSLNHYMWAGLDNETDTLESVRRSSEILALSIVTAAAMHVPDQTAAYDACYSEFVSLVSRSMFTNGHNYDDVLGLCIAAFWFSSISWKVSAHAIRIATELELHKSFAKAAESKEHHVRARMWYMLYVCDHHFAIAFGRPPMIRDDQQIREHESFLKYPHATSLDRRLLSQVALFSILTQIHDRLDEDPVKQSIAEKTRLIQEFNIQLEQWRLTWVPRQQLSKYIGSFPPKGIVLYYHFAKLQLNTLALRQTSATRVNDLSMDPNMKELINLATTAALNIINLLLEDQDMRRALVGVPLYVHTMLTFACLFLFKISTSWRFKGISLAMDLHSLCNMFDRTIKCIRTSSAGERHLLHRIASGLEKMLRQCESPQRMEALHVNGQYLPQDGNENPDAGVHNDIGVDSGYQNSFAQQLQTWDNFVGDAGLADLTSAFGTNTAFDPFADIFDVDGGNQGELMGR